MSCPWSSFLLHGILTLESAIHTPARFGIPYMAPLIRTPDEVDLSCYFLPQTEGSLAGTLALSARQSRHGIEDVRVDLTPAVQRAQATVIVFHGNAAHHWEDMQSAKDFFNMKCNVMLASYRGYVHPCLDSS